MCATFILGPEASAQRSPSQKQGVKPGRELAPSRALNDSELADLEGRIRKARSKVEAAVGIRALVASADSGFPVIEKLVADPSLHPEVRFHLTRSALRSKAKRALQFCASFLDHEDRDLRFWAAKVVAQDARPEIVDTIIASIAGETDVELMNLKLSALGVTGESAKVLPILKSYLNHDVEQGVMLGAAYAIGRLHEAALAPDLLALITAEMTLGVATNILLYTHWALDNPKDEAELLKIAGSSKHKLQLWAVDRLRFFDQNPTLSTYNTIVRARQTPALQALSSDSELIRRGGVRALAQLGRTPFGFLRDTKTVARISERAKDSSANVRLATANSLHDTVLRRGLNVPGLPPMALEGETMRMLRWPADWVAFEALVDLLDDSDEATRNRAAWMLGISTGYWHGYKDINLRGTPQLTPEVIQRYQQMLDEMKATTPREFAVTALENAASRLSNTSRVDTEAEIIKGIWLLTGRKFGLTVDDSATERTDRIKRFKRWLGKNRHSHPTEWIVNAVVSEGLQRTTGYNIYVLARWGMRDMPLALVDIKLQNSDPETVLRRLTEWYESTKHELD